jgi:serine protease
MKKLLLSVSALLFSLGMFAQTVHKDYLDGAIWVNLKNSALNYQTATFGGAVQSGEIVHLDKLPIGRHLNGKGVKAVSRPFHMVNDPLLKNVIRIEFSDIHSVDGMLAALNQDPNVVYAERVPLLHKTVTPNDPSYNPSTQWNLFQVNASQAWAISTGSPNIRVAIVDDAIQINHPDLQPSIWTNVNEVPGNGIDDDGNGYIDDINGWDVATGTNNPNPPNNTFDHGTHVAGIAGARTNNGIGVASIGHNIRLIAVKATTSASFVTHGYEGVIYSVAAGAHVINMSWGGSGFSTTAQNIINYASNQGVVLVAAAGNDNVSSVFYPAGYSQVIAVASTTFGDAKSGFSNFGSWIDISAPGSAIYSTIVGSSYGTKQGTSMASPMVAGLAGLMLSLNPSLSPADIKTCLQSSATNIDAANPSFIGQLGAGRINAFAAMNCVSATLNWAPEADFVASAVNILEGQTVNFTDLSIYNPTTWSWTFTGGTPATFNGQNPPAITYNTAGVYPVSLTVTNANGNDTETKTGYITVNALTGCDEITNTVPADPINIWTWGAPNGYILGQNYVRYNRVAERFVGYGPTHLMGATFYFVRSTFTNPNNTFTVKVWADAGGLPGAELYAETMRYSDIAANITPTGFFPTNIDFNLPVQVTGGNFFIGYEYAYQPSGGDTIVCAASGDLTPNPSRNNSVFVHVNPADNPFGITPTGWQQVSNIGTIQLAMHVYPRITSLPPTAIINATPSTVCVGDFIQFNAANSPNLASWQWAINGTSTPYPTAVNPNVVMNAAGNHWVYLLAQNSCGYYHIDSIQVTVNPTPNVTLTASNDTICPGGSVNFNASGASSYVWSPGGSLSCTTCPNPVATPASNTTYTVTGTQGSCSSNAYFTVIVDAAAPTAFFLQSSDTICEGDALALNGALSDGGSVFTWTMNGATPGTGSGSIINPTYPTAGTYPIQLVVANSCGQTDNASGSVVVLASAVCSASLDGLDMADIQLYYDYNNSRLVINLEQISGSGRIELFNMAGQKVFENAAKTGAIEIIDVNGIAPGLYILNLMTEQGQQTLKFVR